jgi:serine/threonine-protein kinase SRPK3
MPGFGLLTVMIALWRANDDFLPVTPMALRAPELIQPRSWDQKVDIWAIGCLVNILYPSCGI